MIKKESIKDNMNKSKKDYKSSSVNNIKKHYTVKKLNLSKKNTMKTNDDFVNQSRNLGILIHINTFYNI